MSRIKYLGYVGIMENTMEATTMGLYRLLGLGIEGMPDKKNEY